MVKSLLQALIHEIRVDHSASLSCAFGGDAMAGDAVRAPSRSVDLGSHNKNQHLSSRESCL